MDSTKTYHVRVQSNRAYTYGLGEEVSPNVHLFKAPDRDGRNGHYDLTKEELDRAIANTGHKEKPRGN
jgi:hypothetical protein